MTIGEGHTAVVEAWVVALGERPAGAVLHALERSVAAVWRRAQRTLGDVTLLAIGDRVLGDAIERFPAFDGVELDEGGLACGAADLDGRDAHEIVSFARFVLSELLAVLGLLTAEVLTPALQAVLGDALRGDAERSDGRSSTSRQRSAGLEAE